MKRIGIELLQAGLLLLLGMLVTLIFNIGQQVFLVYYCPTYYTQYLNNDFPTNNQLLLGLDWGFFASWWIGLPLSIIFVLVARVGTWPQRSARQILPIALALIVGLWVSGLLFGALGYATAQAYLNADNNSVFASFYGSLIQSAQGSVSNSTFLRLAATGFADTCAYIYAPAGAFFVIGLIWGQRWGLQQVKLRAKTGVVTAQSGDASQG